jgi:hypothetical protein
MIGERRMLFEQRFPVYTEFKRLGELEVARRCASPARRAGEVTDIQLPTSPRELQGQDGAPRGLHPIVRADSVAATQTEGLGGRLLNIAAGTEQAPLLPTAEPSRARTVCDCGSSAAGERHHH